MSDEPNFYYANAVELAVTPYDFGFKFQRNEFSKPVSGEEPKPVTVDTMVIAMSPAHAKAMLPAIYNALIEYEKMFGKIGLLPDMQAAFDKAFGKISN